MTPLPLPPRLRLLPLEGQHVDAGAAVEVGGPGRALRLGQGQPQPVAGQLVGSAARDGRAAALEDVDLTGRGGRVERERVRTPERLAVRSLQPGQLRALEHEPYGRLLEIVAHVLAV